MTARVLIIDDEPQILRFLSHALTASGYAVTQANTARDGLQAVFAEQASERVESDLRAGKRIGHQVEARTNQVPPDQRLKINMEVVGLDQGGRLEPTVENVLFRVIQELVQNILKHAQATQVTLQIIRHPDELTVMVEDNGVGFDPAALGEDAGIGLKNIESRMAFLGGRADFDAAPGRGTTVTLEIPLAAVPA